VQTTNAEWQASWISLWAWGFSQSAEMCILRETEYEALRLSARPAAHLRYADVRRTRKKTRAEPRYLSKPSNDEVFLSIDRPSRMNEAGLRQTAELWAYLVGQWSVDAALSNWRTPA